MRRRGAVAIVMVCALLGAVAGAGTAMVLADDDPEVATDEGGARGTEGTLDPAPTTATGDGGSLPDVGEGTTTTRPDPPEVTEAPAEPSGPTPAEVLSQHGEQVVAIEAVGCRYGTFATGVITAPGTVSAPFDLRFRLGYVQVVGEAGVPVMAEVASATASVTVLAASGVAPSVASFSATPDLVEDAPAFVVYRDRVSHGAEVVEVRVAEVSADRVRLTAPGVPLDALGGLVVAANGDSVGLVTSIAGADVDAALVGVTGPAEASLAPEDLPCPEADTGVPSSSWAEFTQPAVASALLAQYLADSLAFDDWVTVRALEPGKADYADSRFQEGWGTLLVSTLIPVWRVETSASVYQWRMGLIAHELVDGAAVTKVFCVTWVADLATGSLEQLNRPLSKRLESLETSGFTDPNSITDIIEDECRSIEGD